MASKRQLRYHTKAENRANDTATEHRFVLDADAFAEFEDMLDNEPQVNDRLAKLLSAPSVFDIAATAYETGDHEPLIELLNDAAHTRAAQRALNTLTLRQ